MCFIPCRVTNTSCTSARWSIRTPGNHDHGHRHHGRHRLTTRSFADGHVGTASSGPSCLAGHVQSSHRDRSEAAVGYIARRSRGRLHADRDPARFGGGGDDPAGDLRHFPAGAAHARQRDAAHPRVAAARAGGDDHAARSAKRARFRRRPGERPSKATATSRTQPRRRATSPGYLKITTTTGQRHRRRPLRRRAAGGILHLARHRRGTADTAADTRQGGTWCAPSRATCSTRHDA